jgi:hypothetical protein
MIKLWVVVAVEFSLYVCHIFRLSSGDLFSKLYRAFSHAGLLIGQNIQKAFHSSLIPLT